jgi:WD40 repeat protein
VAWSKDGKRFASGGYVVDLISFTRSNFKISTNSIGRADSQIIIWAQKQDSYAGVLKYTHGDPIQCIAYNPGNLNSFFSSRISDTTTCKLHCHRLWIVVTRAKGCPKKRS